MYTDNYTITYIYIYNVCALMSFSFDSFSMIGILKQESGILKPELLRKDHIATSPPLGTSDRQRAPVGASGVRAPISPEFRTQTPNSRMQNQESRIQNPQS